MTDQIKKIDESELEQKNNNAIASLILGVVAILTIGIFGLGFSAVLAVIGLFLGIRGVKIAEKRWMAMVGIMLCSLIFLMGLIALPLIFQSP